MTGGTIVASGDAGEQVGRGMRRGLVAIAGSVGQFAALEMLAGTIIVLGDCGRRAGVGMRRGTLAVLGSLAPLLPSFRSAGRCDPQFMRLYLVHLRRLGFPVGPEMFEAAYQLYHGDMLAIGRGEIIARAA
jgi:formylmethanofuran dehydrogenase subunit C